MKTITDIALMFCSTISAILMLNHPVAAGEFVGVQEFVTHSQERNRDLAMTVWYPADAGGKQVTLGESVFFEGTNAMLEAPISRGKYPVILLSHGAGLGGNPQAASWLATPLAKQGFIVAAPAHPGNGGVTRSAAETMKLWLRPADISATLDLMQKLPLFQDHLAEGKIGALGLSMGGGTALALAGARFDPMRLAGYCDTDTLNASLCEWVRQSGVDLHALDMGLAGRNNEDERILFVMAIDPAPADVFKPGSFAGISIPVDLVNLGHPESIPQTALASEIAKLIARSRYSIIEDASHYSMFGECKPKGAAIAEAEKVGDPICFDGGGQSRREIHEQLIKMVSAAFARELQTAR
ncbi:dienelactone hydrolase [Aureimonas fodinaquatilis]|uniref:Dienelactone hydrolase n=1 Tax=Aureimonas fodinaquatilis TaxID=2565783 RepID=A0A5B0E3U3_9HYPH|nr:alpha/beta fold hydrolase [Aureimonas fodinaquatilis]KAA0972611.1 dienelactone hydrolase [Aureimonas fodinaquatilis]